MIFRKKLIPFLVLSVALPTLVACGGQGGGGEEEEKYITVHFEPLTSISIFPIEDKELSSAKKIIPPTVVIKDESTNPNNLGISGWYKDAAFFEQWDFKTMVVEKDMTLYAKWDKQFTVSYYLSRSFDSSTEAIGAETCFEGDLFVDRTDLYDGYKFEGYYTSPTFEESTKIDISKGMPKVTSNMKVYIKRSEEVYFTPKALANRFDNAMAASGKGSTTPTVQLKTEDDEEFYEVNFGYSTARDPYVYCINPTFDILHTKKLKITFRNRGNADAIKLYWAAKDKFNNFTDGSGYYESSACIHEYTDDEKEMTEWKTITMDVAGDAVKNGYSTWGVANQLVRLRIQNQYLSTGPEDYSNVLQIKSIEGVDGDDYKKAEDSDIIKAMCQDDKKEDLEKKSKEQEGLVPNGLIFPRDYNKRDVQGSTENSSYNRVDGVLLHSNYGDGKIENKFKFIDDETTESPISLDDLTTITITLKNFGYVSNVTLTIENTDFEVTSVNLGLDTKMSTTGDYVTHEVNMFGKGALYRRGLRSVTFSYNTTGVDNAILIQKVEFKEYKEQYVHGINFIDKNIQGLKSDEKMEVSYNNLATEVNVLQSGASFTIDRLFNNFSMKGYKALALNFFLSATTLSNVTVDLNVDDTIYNYSFDLASSTSLQTLSLPLQATGYVKWVKFTFTGTGLIRLKSLSFTTNDTSFSFANRSYFDKMLSGDWYKGETYLSDYSAVSIGNGDQFLCYAGADGITGLMNFDLKGKTKIYITYQNKSAKEKIYVGMGCGEKMGDEDYKVNNRYIGNGTGYLEVNGLRTNMGEMDWETCELDIATALPGKDYQNWVATVIGLTQFPKMYIRSIIIA